jgi:3-methyladenine DNA glycosylase AlkD
VAGDAVTALAAELDAASTRLRGAPTARWRALRREYSRRLVAAPAAQVLRLADRLLAAGESGRRFVAYELVHGHRAALGALRERHLARLGRGCDGWGDVDAFACYLAGPAWREGQVSDALIRRWARSPSRWWRRAALVSTVPLNSRARGASAPRGDARRTLATCRLLVTDRDDMVVKAMSWALRELAKRDPAAVRRFLAAHRDALAPRVAREVRNKLETGRKNPRGGARRAARS